MTASTTSVLFVCLGNICRSPMAEAVFKDLLQEQGLQQQFRVDSAGTAAWKMGSAPHPGTMGELLRRGVGRDYDHRARVATTRDLQDFHWVLAVDRETLHELQQLGPAQHRLELLLRFGAEQGRLDVPDPFIHGGFALVYDLIDEACRGLLQEILRQRSAADHS